MTTTGKARARPGVFSGRVGSGAKWFASLGLCALAALPLLAAERPQDKAAAELVRNWTPAHQAASEAWATIAEKRFNDGERAFTVALERAAAANWPDAQRAGLLEGRATVRLNIGRFAAARTDNDAALAVIQEPRARVGALFNRVRIARALGDFRLATDTLRALEKTAAPDRNDKYYKESARVLLLEEARNRRAWGDFPGAIEAFEEAKKLDDKSTDGLRELAGCYLAQHEPAKALALAQQALEQDLHLRGLTRRRPREQWIEAGDANMLAALLTAAECAAAAREFAAADAHFQTAAALAARLAQLGARKSAILQQARAWLAAGDARAAQITAPFLADLAAVSDVPETRQRIDVLSLAGELALHIAKPAEAAQWLDAAVALIEQTRATASVEDRRNYLIQQADNYRRLVAAHTRTGNAWSALLAAESLKARQLLETLEPGSVKSDLPAAERLAKLRALQGRLPADAAVISYANADWSRTPPAAIVVTRDGIAALELPAARIKFALEDLPTRAILEAQKRDIDASRYDLGSDITLAGLIAYYRECLTAKGDEIPARIKPQIAIARLLHDVLVAPLRPALGERKRLLVVPSGLLAYLPFETLANREGHMLVGDHAITLTPSLLTTMAIATRPPATFARPLLAFGGAVYKPESYEQDMRNAEPMKQQFQLMLAARNAAFAGNRSPYYGVFGGPMNNLAGSKAEVQMLSELVPESRVVIGREVNEAHVRELAAAGELKTSRVLHFAVHGSAQADMPSLSCIALSYEGHFTQEMPAERDGLLQLTEIQNLPLRAELVTLSACETGLGAIIAGEGVVGLTGAFLTAGSDRVLASLWPVSDAGTVYFMQRFYQLHLIEGVPGDLAMAAVKREFIMGKAGGFRHPQFWAPFNLYGGADLLEAAK